TARQPKPRAEEAPSEALRGSRFARPAEDEDEDEGDEPPAGPYNWGVKAAAKPKGAWLLDTPDETDAPAPPASGVPEASKGAASPAAAGGGARNYLVRKAGEEVQRFRPVLKALKEAKILDTTELEEASA